MRRISKLLAAACGLLIGHSANAGLVTFTDPDLTFQFDPTIYSLPLVAPVSPFDFQMVASSHGTGIGSSDRGSTSFRLTLTNPDVRLVGLSLVQTGTYALYGKGSRVSAQGALSVVGEGVADANTSSSFVNTTRFVADGMEHSWVMAATALFNAPRWGEVRAIDLKLTTALSAYATNGAGDFAYITGKSPTEQELILGGGGNPGTGPTVTPLPASTLLMATGLLALAGFGRLRIRRAPRTA